jgi:subtilisin family serine protease
MSRHPVLPPVGALRVLHAWRRRALAGLGALALAATALHGMPARAQPAAGGAVDEIATEVATTGSARVIVRLNVSTSPEGRLDRINAMQQRERIRVAQDTAVSTLLAGTRSRLKARFETLPHLAAEVDETALARLRASPLVAGVEVDRAVPTMLLQSTALIGAPTSWNSGITGSGWTVAVLDTGIDKNHPFLAGKVVSEACYSSTTTQSNSVCPGGVSSSTAAGSGVHCNPAIAGCDHGTHVASIVAGSGAPDGSQGVAPSAGLIAIQVFSHFPGQGAVMSYTSDQILGLERVYALKDTYRIAAVNMSLGGGQYASTCDADNTALKAAIDNLRSVGIATVIASGNNGYRNALSAPACISTAVSVGATCDTGPDGSACGTGVNGVASYSNTAPFLSLVAPGSYITAAVPGGGYQAKSGTSMAAPHVAGAWALLKQANPDMSVTDALSMLRNQAAPINDTRTSGTVTDLRSMRLSFLTGTAHALTVSRAGSGTGSVKSAPLGINCGSDCSEAYTEGTMVTLTPTAGAYSTFAGWSGACTGTSTCTVTMSEARNVTATFNAAPYTLTVTRSGTGAGTVTSAPAGIACGSTCTAAMNGGASVTLTATPATGSRFAGWSGACTGTTSTCTVSMTAARSVTATFTLQTYAVSVTRGGTGTGTVTSSPSGVNCGSTCSVSRTYGSVLTLTATPAAGNVFAGWSGACTGTGTCAVTVDAAKAVTATFTRTHNTLTVTRAGTGAGTVTSSPAGISCGATCSALMPVETPVTLTAVPAAGSVFTSWSGACTGSGTTCTVPMNQAQGVTATFTRLRYTLEVAKSGTGSGTVTSSPTGIACGSTCSAVYNSLTTVTLTPAAATDSVFSGWSGACSGTGPCTVTMNQATQVGATFTRTRYTLAVTKAGTGTGTVTSSPAGVNCGSTCSALMPIGSTVTLTPVPAAEMAFAGWSGACTGTGACTVTMSQAQAVTATFNRVQYTLTVTKAGTGVGSVSSSPDGISNCTSTCKASMPINSAVTLTPTAAAGHQFTGWSGACTGTGACTVTMSAARSVTATFAPITHTLTVTKTGSGTVASSPSGISCGSTCTRSFNQGTTVTLTATAASGWRFAGWGGACSGTATTCSAAMTQASGVTATFASP